MVDGIFLDLLQSHGLGVAVLLASVYVLYKGVVMLWGALKDSFTDRINALETAVKDCHAKHEECEDGKRSLTLALIDVVDGRDEAAREKCQSILKGGKP